MAGDPVSGFGERITTRARLPCTATLFYPIAILMLGYFSNEVANSQDYLGAIKELKDNAAIVLSPLAVIPVAAFAFFREIGLHSYLDKIIGVRKSINALIVNQMSELARESGYDHPSRILDNKSKATNWFYSYINKQTVTRAYAFELWEGYYVGLYISLASAISLLMCLYLFAISTELWVLFCSVAPLALFLLMWIVRRNSTLPKMEKLVRQQVGEIERDGDALREAQKRFG
jgi:hypothetical protein